MDVRNTAHPEFLPRPRRGGVLNHASPRQTTAGRRTAAAVSGADAIFSRTRDLAWISSSSPPTPPLPPKAALARASSSRARRWTGRLARRPRPPAGSPAPRARRWTSWRRRAWTPRGWCWSAPGKAEAFDALGAEHAAASAYEAVKASGLTTLRIELPDADAGAGGARGARRAPGQPTGSTSTGPRRRPRRSPRSPRPRSWPPTPTRALAAFAPLAALADAVQLHPRPGLRARQRPLSRRVRPPGEGAGEPGPGGRDPRRGGDDEARHGLAAGRRPGQRPREPAGGDPVERAPPTRRPSRSPSSARASASTPAASRSSRPTAWRT